MRRSFYRTFLTLIIVFGVTVFGPPFASADNLGRLIPSSATVRNGGADSELPPVIIRDPLLPEGTRWDSTEAVKLSDRFSEIVLEFEEQVEIGTIWLQADANDAYFVDAANDRNEWAPISAAPKILHGHGLRTRALKKKVRTSKLRIRPASGDGWYSIGRLQLFSASVTPGDPPVSFDQVGLVADLALFLKHLIPLLALVPVSLWLFAQRESVRRWSRTLAGVLAAISFALWWNLFTFHRGEFVHHWDFAHYYLGSKYFDELGFTRLYHCVLAADLESGAVPPQPEPVIRDLSTNQLVPLTRLVPVPGECHSYFTDRRWREFASDVAWFRERTEPERWAQFKRDHGFNGTPAWTAVGSFISNQVPLSTVNVVLLAALDTVLLLGMWALAVWAFGWTGVVVPLIYWGTNHYAPYYWTGGSFLRFDWLALLIASIAFLKKGMPGVAGTCFAYAAMLRVFPAVAIVPWCLLVIRRMVVERSLAFTRVEKRFIAGGILAALILTVIPLIQFRQGTSLIPEVAANLEKHRNTPLTNSIGVPFLLSYSLSTRAHHLEDPRSTDAYAFWKSTQRETFGSRLPIFILLVAGYAAVFLLRPAALEPWEVIALGVTAIPLFTSLTCYYYGFLMALGLLAGRSKMTAVLLVFLAYLSQAATWWLPGFEDQGAAATFFIIILSAAALSSVIRQREETPSAHDS